MEKFINLSNEQKLSQELHCILYKTVDFIKTSQYIPRTFLSILNETKPNGVEATIRILKSVDSSGFNELKCRKLLKYSVEAIVLSKRYRNLFPRCLTLHCESLLKNDIDLKSLEELPSELL